MTSHSIAPANRLLRLRILLSIVLAGLTAACPLASEIASPALKLHFPSTASIDQTVVLPVDATGYDRVELWIAGQLVASTQQENPNFHWRPSALGLVAASVKGIKDGKIVSEAAADVAIGLQNWQWLEPKTTWASLCDVAWAFGRWWVCGTESTLLTSVDGLRWERRNTGVSGTLRGMATDGNRLLIACGNKDLFTGQTNPGILSTTDGITWTPFYPGDSGWPTTMASVRHFAGQWVAAGDNGTFLFSTDGKTWSTEKATREDLFYDIARSPSQWMAGGQVGCAVRWNGNTYWDALVSPFNLQQYVPIRSIDYHDGLWFAAGGSTHTLFLSSTNGMNWTVRELGSRFELSRVRRIDDRWVVMGSDGKLFSSQDTQLWNSHDTGRKSTFQGAAKNGGVWVVVGTMGEIMTGPDLDRLTAIETSPRPTIRAMLPLKTGVLALSDTKDAATGAASPPIVEYSKPGGWKLSGINLKPDETRLRGFAAGPAYQLAVGAEGLIYKATDHHSWNRQASLTTVQLNAVAIDSALAIAVGDGGAILTSQDGTYWIKCTSGTTENLVAVASGQSGYVACGASGALRYSADGITWTEAETVPEGARTWQKGALLWVDGIGFLANARGEMLHSKEGRNWTSTLKGTNPRYERPEQMLTHLVATPHGVVVTTKYNFGYLSRDGKNWVRIPLGANSDPWSQVVSTGETLWAGGADGGMLFHELKSAMLIPKASIPNAPQEVAQGSALRLSARIEGEGPLQIQWYRDGQPVSGATGERLEYPAAQPSHTGSYTVSARNAAGIAYSAPVKVQVTTTEDPSERGRLTNLSIRTRTGGSGTPLIMGIIVGGDGSSGTCPLLVRAAGPTLATYGVSGTLADPVLTCYSGSTVVSTNDDWHTGPSDLARLFERLQAFPFHAATSKDAALFIHREGGSCTIQVTGSTPEDTGVALAEVYDASEQWRPPMPRLVNASARAVAGSGDGVLIAGFTVGGKRPCSVLVRAVGPTLTSLGVPGALADPRLELFAGTTKLHENDNWGGRTDIAEATRAINAFSLAANSKDAALLLTLQPGAYSAQVRGAEGLQGEVLIEIYEVP